MFPVVPVTLRGMKQRSRQQVGELVKARRLKLGITEKQVLAETKIDSKTLKGIESGDRWPQEETRLKVEKILRWLPGSIEALRQGKDAIPFPDDVVVQPEPARLLARVPTVELLDELRERIVSSDDPESRDRIAAWSERGLDAVRNHGRLDDARYRHQ